MRKQLGVLLSAAMLFNMAACSQNTTNETANTVPSVSEAAENTGGSTRAEDEPGRVFKAGIYEGTAAGRNGEIKVEVVLTGDTIQSVMILEHQETAGIADPALENIPADIVQYQSLGVDAVSGATITSEALLEAVSDAIGKSGADVEALRQVKIEKEVALAEDMTTQVVVVGGGVSGVSAALTAAHEGAEVLLIEKQAQVGGSSALAAGGLVIVNGEMVPEDMDDSLETTLEAVRKIHEDSKLQPDYDYLSKILEKTGPAQDYLHEIGLQFDTFFFNMFARSRFESGRSMMDRLAALAEENGVTILVNTTGTALVMDGDAVIGVKAESEGGEFTIHADKVILATGGANYDRERLLESTPQLAEVDLLEAANAGNTGDGFRMLEEIGAAMSPQTLIKSGALASNNAGTFYLGTTNAMVVDDEGKRFMNEGPIQYTMANTWAIQHGSPAYYAIYNSANANEEVIAAFKENVDEDDPKKVLYAETIEELAQKAKIPAENLRVSFDRYQELALAGEDKDFGKNPELLIPYADNEGYYLAYVQPSSWGTMGGAITDESFHVLKEDGSPIPNVFAIGETATGRFFGDQYVGAFSLGLYITAGQVAGSCAAQEILEP